MDCGLGRKAWWRGHYREGGQVGHKECGEGGDEDIREAMGRVEGQNMRNVENVDGKEMEHGDHIVGRI